jgi:hypothetical protein
MSSMRTVSTKKKVFLVLLATVYLTVFIAHDIIVDRPPQPPPTQTEADNSLAPADLHQGQLVSASEHHCPFCSGFVDTHIDPFIGTIESSWLGVSLPVIHYKPLPTQHSCRPRDPPSINV